MARVVILVMILVVGSLWVVGQAVNTMKIVEQRHSTMMEMTGK